jgi:hypothetical protein
VLLTTTIVVAVPVVIIIADCLTTLAAAHQSEVGYCSSKGRLHQQAVLLLFLHILALSQSASPLSISWQQLVVATRAWAKARLFFFSNSQYSVVVPCSLFLFFFWPSFGARMPTLVRISSSRPVKRMTDIPKYYTTNTSNAFDGS